MIMLVFALAIVVSLTLAAVVAYHEPGERTVRLEEVWVDRLGAMRRPNESYSDVIMRLAEGKLQAPNAI
jgi:hypothetical protein